MVVMSFSMYYIKKRETFDLITICLLANNLRRQVSLIGESIFTKGVSLVEILLFSVCLFVSLIVLKNKITEHNTQFWKPS